MKLLQKYGRISSQVASLFVLNASYLFSNLKGICVPILHCYACPLAVFACPIGTTQYALMIGKLPFIVIGMFILVVIFMGRLLCFYVCPFGFLQDMLFKLSKVNIPIPRFLSYGKYFFLLMFVIIMPIVIHEPIFCKLCPAGALEAGLPIVMHAKFIEPVITGPLGSFPNPILDMVGQMFVVKMLSLIIIAGAAMLMYRPFCRIICPVAACKDGITSLIKKKAGKCHCAGRAGKCSSS